MKQYKWILFDADETLFHFDAFSGLQRVFSQFNVNFTEEDYQQYEIINKPLWVEYQQGIITAQQLQHQRFDILANKLAVSTQVLNSAFLAAMADICVPLAGAENLLNTLRGKVKLGIVTNGFTELQQARLLRTGLRDHFEVLIISEEVGIAKPHPGIFEHAITLMNHPLREEVLMVGDNPESDILGGINAGLDTCWLNIHNKSLPAGITPRYEVASLLELQEMFLQQGKREVS